MKSDHDLLISIHEILKNVVKDISEMKEDLKGKVNLEVFQAHENIDDDHEERLRSLEGNKWFLVGWATAASTFISWIVTHVLKI